MSAATTEGRMPRVSIDAAALAGNWRKLAALSPAGRTGAAVKADGYGLGAARVASTLFDAGCRDFFVAWATEGIALHESLGDRPARIFVLQGLDTSNVSDIRDAGLVPVLSTPEDVALWLEAGGGMPAALQFETGMNRLGLDAADAMRAAELTATGALKLKLVMSHLASADEAGGQAEQQLGIFDLLANLFPGVPRSLANSAAMLRGAPFRLDLNRPGIALYGGGDPDGRFGLAPVASLTAAVLQVRTADRGEAAGYGAAARLRRDTRIATVGIGYADGLMRMASGAGVPAPANRPPPAAFIAGRAVPILGRISMDLTLLDVTDLPDGAVKPGDRAEFFGPNVSIDRVALGAGTIPYELLTGLGARVARVWP
ncbi:alanine racemase [Aureimonas leprariae]|uniref:Alanine racemase n=1 Tax=Plantimonas leprariae TaxID=2615207 RepID=A0A7V7PQR8_9HYPH|nr:alanine racemase [Aureimonas leprariae]KAB0680655.1 alanine racemase [Aureimonas leprariae]